MTTDTPLNSGTPDGGPWSAGRIVAGLLVVMAVLPIAVWLWIGAERVAFPYEIESVENGTLDEAVCVLEHGHPYVPPSSEYVASIYAPVYAYSAALGMKVAGLGFAGPRAVSYAATAGSFLLIGWIAARLGRRRSAGWLAAGLYAVSYAAGGTFFDLARVDPLAIFFLLAGLALLLSAGTAGRAAWAGLLFMLAVYAKQTVILAPLAMLAALALLNRRQMLAFSGAFFGVCAAAFLILQLATGGWFAEYVMGSPAQHALSAGAILSFWRRDLAGTMPIALVATVYACLRAWRQADPEVRRERLLLTAFVLGAVAVSWGSRVHSGGHINVLLPAFAAFAIGAGAAWGDLSAGLAGRREGAPVAVACLAAVAMQFALLSYNPMTLRPRAIDYQTAAQLLEVVKQGGDRVWAPHHTWIQRQAGKPPGVYWVNLGGIRVVENGRSVPFIPPDLKEAWAEKRFSRIIVDEDEFRLRELIGPTYREAGTVFTRRADEAITSIKSACCIYEPRP